MSTLKKRSGIYQYHHGDHRVSLRTRDLPIAKKLQDIMDLKRLTGQLDVQRIRISGIIGKYQVFIRETDTIQASTKLKVLQQMSLFATFCKQNDIFVDQLTAQYFHSYARWRSISSVKNDLMAINKMFTWGESLGYNLKVAIPISGYTLKKSTKHRAITPQEWQIVLGSNSPYLELYKWLYYTGLRPSDVIRVDESMIRDNILHLTPQKTEQSSNISILIPLHKTLFVIHTMPNLDKARRELKSILGSDVTLYSFRYSFNARMKEAGLSLEERKDAMGHTNIRTTEGYSTPDISHLTAHISNLD